MWRQWRRRHGEWQRRALGLRIDRHVVGFGEELEFGGTSPTKTLKDQIAACQAVEQKGQSAQSTADMVASQAAVAKCYQDAVNSHTAEIEAKRKGAGGMLIEPATATAAAFFADYRKNHDSIGTAAPQLLCDVAHAASESFGGTLQHVEDASCVANIEIRLSKLVASEADLPGGSTPLTGADGTAEQLHQLVAPVVTQTIANTPGDEAALTASVTAAFDGAVAASTELCGLLEDAGQMAGGTGAKTLADACTAKAIGLLVAEVSTWVQPSGG